MLAKLTRGNQITIPKEVVRQAGLKEGRDYLDVEYDNGTIRLRPVEIEERIPPQSYENLLKSAFEIEKGDMLVADNTEANPLIKRSKKR